MLLFYVYGVQTYSIYNDPLFEEIGASGAVGHELLPNTIEELSQDSNIYFVKTHSLPTDENPAIYLFRDGRDALVSHTRYILAFKRTTLTQLSRFVGLANFYRTLRKLIVEPRSSETCWSNHVFSWTRDKRDGMTTTIRYEDLILDPVTSLASSLEALQIQLELRDGHNLPSFDELHRKWPQFFRKGKNGSWRQEMPNDLHQLFWQYHGEAMEAFGYLRNPINLEVNNI
jgi:hypothetical protein